MKRIFTLFILLCGITILSMGQGKFLNTLKKELKSVAGVKTTHEPIFVYPENGVWKMSFVSCSGNLETGEVILRIKAMPLQKSPGKNVNCYLINVFDLDGKAISLTPRGADNWYELTKLTNTEITFQTMKNVPKTVKTIHAKFIIGSMAPNNTFEIHNIPINWMSPVSKQNIEEKRIGIKEGKVDTLIVETERIDTITITTPEEVQITKIPGYVDKVNVIREGGLHTDFFHFINLNDEFEPVDMELFNKEQFSYSLAIGLKNKPFPVERAYEGFGNLKEDKEMKHYYVGHMAKCYVVAENGKTKIAERETISENYLTLAISKFVADNMDDGFAFLPSAQPIFPVMIPLYTRQLLAKPVQAVLANTLENPNRTLSYEEQYFVDYIKKYPPRKSQITFMGDENATQIEFEYKFFDQELALHAFIFSPITLHYEIRSWYNKDHDVTMYAYFYCVGYDNLGMEQAIGKKDYLATKEDFKKRNNLDFEQYPLYCLMMDFSKILVMNEKPPIIDSITFVVPPSWNINTKPSKTITTTEKKKVKEPIVVKQPDTYVVSSNSVVQLKNISAIDIAEDASYTYIAGTVKSGHSKLFAIDKSSGEVTEMYTNTWGDKGDKGEVKRLMQDHEGKVLVEFAKYPIMSCFNATLEDTKLRFVTDNRWETPYYPKLKAVMPDGDVLMVNGNENILVDRNSGKIKASSKKMYFGELRGRVAVTKPNVIWEPGSGSYMHVTGFGTLSEPLFTKFDTGYDSSYKGGVNEIKVASSGDIYISSRFGLHKSTDNGKNWLITKSIYANGSFQRISSNSKSETWASTDSREGQCIVKYDDKLSKILYRTSTFDMPGQNGGMLKLQTTPRVLFVDSADNLWILGGTYGTTQIVLLFNPEGVKGYDKIAVEKTIDMQ